MKPMIAVLLVSLLAPLPAQAQSGDNVKINSDTLSVDDAAHLSVFTGSVEVIQPNMTLYADRVEAHYGDEGVSDLQSMVATGSVHIVTPDQDVKGQKAVYDPKGRELHVTGNVVVVNASGTVKGPELIVNIDTGASTFVGSKSGRVTGVFSTGGS